MTSSDKNMQPQIEGLATLLVLDDEIRKLTSLREFGFFAANETHRLIPYHTGWLWKKNIAGRVSLLNQSGTAEIDASSPLNQWIIEKIKTVSHSDHKNEIFQQKIETQGENAPPTEFADILPPNFIWSPLLNHEDKISGGLILFREMPFTDQEIKMLKWLFASYQYTWIVLTSKKSSSPLEKLTHKKITGIIILIITGILLFPVKLSILGSAIVTARDPVLINAPMQGVIKSFSVIPGQNVQAGTLLFSLDKTDLISDKKISEKELLLTQAKLRTTINESFKNEQRNAKQRDATAEIPILKSQIDIDKAHIEYTQTMLKKADVKSPISGIVIFDSKDDWIGQPVQTGERVLVIANPKRVQLKIQLPVSNSIKVNKNADGDFFVYGKLSSLSIRIKNIGYNARMTPEKILAYPIDAEFVSTKSLPRLGSQGTAKIYGEKVPLIYYLFRRPIQTFRQSFGI